MLGIAETLSKDFTYVRVDLYDIDGQIKFGEMTFTPAAGYGLWGYDTDLLVGELIKLKENTDIEREW